MPGTSGERACGAPAGCIRLGPQLPPVLDRADSGPLAAFSSLHSSGRPDGLSLLAPVGETHPEAQTRRDRGISASLRFRGAWFCPVTPEVGVAAAPPMALSLRASAAARDTRPSGVRKRAPADHVSRASRRGPPQQRHADWGFPAQDSSCGTSNSKFEIRNSNFWIATAWLAGQQLTGYHSGSPLLRGTGSCA
jgi:hypothetical protein